ncbi:hypothetical protein FSP39_020500 [Pinctada imbricata]|uniref:DDE Tnp4 domain-containing protein n=1 Tax=Pinctada imbricata TaxID=66713 RepID=A0AA88YHK5_PINIB|nr:hypothetical protein FSP39_020500 [Pinctada imbricata]
MERKIKDQKEENLHLSQKIHQLDSKKQFNVANIKEDKKLILYYTGYSKETFEAIFKFLVPNVDSQPLTYTEKLHAINEMTLEDQLFLTICKLRNNLDFQDIGCRFGISQQCASVIFNSWINYMFLRFGELCIWPHRDVLFENMPSKFKKDFPTTFAIVDCTEMKIQKPSSLKAQSQTYSDYKSSNTLKALVAVDPRGSVIFSSMLFSGAMSDREIFIQSKFKEMLQKLIEIGYLNTGDGVMGDKGFNIESEVESLGLRLNIPPFAQSGKQMSQHDALYTKKIAMHRVHVERAIRRIKSFKILSGRFPLSLMSSVNQIWYVCSVLTNFMPPCIKEM